MLSLFVITWRHGDRTVANRPAGAKQRIQNIEFRRGIIFLIVFHGNKGKETKKRYSGKKKQNKKPPLYPCRE